MKKIVQNGDPVLREVAKEIPIQEIQSPKIQKIIKEMSSALASQDDGVAIAAPQIGYSLRIFVVSGKIFSEEFTQEKKENTNLDAQETNEKTNTKEKIKDLVFINPKITKLSQDKKWLPEGCLSVRWLYGKVKRSLKATVEAYNEKGEKFTRGGSGLLAHIFQHETDHLNGILFIDNAKDVKEEDPNKENDEQ
jgi:peptide deformylase